MVVSLNAPDVGFRVGFMSFSLPHSSIRLRLLMARPRARVGDGQRLQRSEGCPLPAKSRVARRMAAYGGTVHSRSALGKNRHRQDMAGSVMSQTAALWQSSSRNLGLADWPLSGNRYSSFGSSAVRRL